MGKHVSVRGRFIESRPEWHDPERLPPLALVPLLALMMALLLAGCGVATTGGQQPGGASDQTPTATSGGTPVSSVPPTNAVALNNDNASYTPSATINITVTNHSTTSIFTFDHQTSCTILTLQRQTANGWENTGGCSMGRPTQRIEIKAGATMQIALAPGAGQIHAMPWPAGTYHATLHYALPGQDMEAGATVMSPTFTIS